MILKAPSLETKVIFLKQPESYRPAASAVTWQETHTSWVFFVDDSVYKLKKPVKLPALDFTLLKARERNCREELRLNRRLAPSVYREVVALTQLADGSLCLGGDDIVVDWLVWMHRLPADRMLDRQLAEGRTTIKHIQALGRLLSTFYRKAEKSDIPCSKAMASLAEQQSINREILLTGRFEIDHVLIREAVERVDDLLNRRRQDLYLRMVDERYVEGHGDLRPEHICLTEPIVIFDCLEFSRTLRMIDPFDEIAFLGMECAYLGAEWLGPMLRRRVSTLIQDDISDELYDFYARFRALMRARMALGHLHFGSSTDIEKWQTKTHRYARLALRRFAS